VEFSSLGIRLMTNLVRLYSSCQKDSQPTVTLQIRMRWRSSAWTWSVLLKLFWLTCKWNVWLIESIQFYPVQKDNWSIDLEVNQQETWWTLQNWGWCLWWCPEKDRIEEATPKPKVPWWSSCMWNMQRIMIFLNPNQNLLCFQIGFYYNYCTDVKWYDTGLRVSTNLCCREDTADNQWKFDWCPKDQANNS